MLCLLLARQLKRVSAISCVLLLALGQVACVNLSAAKTHTVSNYQLKAMAPIELPPMPKVQRTVAIKEGFIASINRGTAMPYQVKVNQINYFVESRWQTLPSSMITGALTEALQNSDLFTAVVLAPPFLGPVDQNVAVNLIELIQVFDANLQHSTVHLRVQLVITDGRTGKIEGVKNFDACVAALGNPESGVIGATHALEQVLPEMIRAIYQVNG